MIVGTITQIRSNTEGRGGDEGKSESGSEHQVLSPYLQQELNARGSVKEGAVNSFSSKAREGERDDLKTRR